MKNAHIWPTALGELKSIIPQAIFEAHLRSSRMVTCAGDTLVVAVDGNGPGDWLDDQVQAAVERTVRRLVGRTVEVRFVADEQPVRPTPAPVITPAPFVVPEFDVHTAGWFPVSEYECRFWAPLLGRVAWRVWEIVRRADKRKSKTAWTPARRWTAPAIAEMVPCGRQALVGVVRDGVERQGAFARLEVEGVAMVEKHGQCRHTTYRVRVRVRMTLLRPAQVDRLPGRLQTQHDRWLRDQGLDPQDWNPAREI